MNELQDFLAAQNFQSYIYHLGLFRQSFNNLEYFLRLYLNKKKGKTNKDALKFSNLSQGDICEENDMTDWKSFSELCNSFNSYQSKSDKINFNDLIGLRDALAHWRILGDIVGRMTVIKYSKPKNNQVIVEYKKELKIEDMKQIADEIAKIGMTVSLRGGATIQN